MFNSKIIKKIKKDSEASADLKSMSKFALDTMEPKSIEISKEEDEEEEDDKEEKMPKKKGVSSESKIELEIMLEAAKKKKK